MTTEQVVPVARARRRPLLRLSSARTRILLAYVLLLAMSLGVAGIVVRAVLIERIEDSVESLLAQEVEGLQRLVDGTDPATGQPFADDVRAIFDTFFSRNVAAADEGLYGFVEGQPYLTSAEPPAELTADAAFTARMRELGTP